MSGLSRPLIPRVTSPYPPSHVLVSASHVSSVSIGPACACLAWREIKRNETQSPYSLYWACVHLGFDFAALNCLCLPAHAHAA
eukprot:3817375-Rhodomonas_salina.1